MSIFYFAQSYENQSSINQQFKKVLATYSNMFKWQIREVIEIQLCTGKPSLNRDNGFELANIYESFSLLETIMNIIYITL